MALAWQLEGVKGNAGGFYSPLPQLLLYVPQDRVNKVLWKPLSTSTLVSHDCGTTHWRLAQAPYGIEDT